jgi:hypothetical protein
VKASKPALFALLPSLNQPIALVQPCSPAGMCRQCGEKYFKTEVLKRMGSLYHAIFERNEKPYRTFFVPAVSL